MIFRNLLMVLVLSSCASSKLIYPLEHKKYKGDLVTVQTAIDLAKQSYIASCINNRPKKEKRLEGCVKQANKYLEENVIFILDQNGKVE